MNYYVSGNEIHVYDTTLADHAVAATEGTIAWALAKADTAGGGTVIVGAGTFTLTSGTITVPANVELRGLGRKVTIISQAHATANGITMDDAGGLRFAAVRNLSVIMPAGSTGGASGIYLSGGSYCAITSVFITGGNVNTWGLQANQFYNCRFAEINIGLAGTTLNGIYLRNSENTGNVGDSHFSCINIVVTSTAIALKIVGGASSATVNNCLFSLLHIIDLTASHTATGLSLSGLVQRNTFINCDIEGMATGIVMTGTTVQNNYFITSTFFSNTTDIDNELDLRYNYFLGGNSTFLENESYRKNRKTSVTKTNANYLAISNITKANPAVVTYFGTDPTVGDYIYIDGVGGMTNVNNKFYTVAGVNTGAKTFQLLGINSSAYSDYTTGGVVVPQTEWLNFNKHAWVPINNSGATGTVYMILPQLDGADDAGCEMTFYNRSNGNAIVVVAGKSSGSGLSSDRVFGVTSITPAYKLTSSGAQYERIVMRSMESANWVATHSAGTWS